MLKYTPVRLLHRYRIRRFDSLIKSFKNKTGISEETRELILKTASEMGFVHRKRRASTGSVMHLFVGSSFPSTVPFDNNLFLDKVIQGISFEAQQLNYILNVTYIDFKQLSADKISSLIDSNCRGIILLPTAGEEIDGTMLKSLKIPFVILDKPADKYGLDSITIANAQGVSLAVEHLYELGHKCIAHIGGASNYSNFSERIDGFVNTVALHPEMKGSEQNVFRINRTLPSSADYFIELNSIMDQLLETDCGMPTGFVCATDWIAVSCIQTLTARGYKVPEDVSVIGFDNIAVSEISTPRLTTINVPKERLGALAVDRLDDIINGKVKERVRISLLTDLVVRDSTGPVKA